MDNVILEKIYAGFLGMNAGIRLGAPVEPAAWDFHRIAQFYGEIDSYVKNYKNFAADDDVNGPVYFLRALQDNGLDRPLTPQAVGDCWLNYARDGIGMYWWGGYQVSSEHTAYDNLKNGIPAPRSGSAEVNGIVLAEQIGGQIFIDTWGLICPNDPEKAAKLAATAASVSHDGNGLYGAAFLAACIAKAFHASSIDEILDEGLRQIPTGCTYAAVVNGVRAFHAEHPEDFRACMEYLIGQWGYDRYPGVCHIIPNAGVCALAMVYGEGDFARTIEIATMCGWDTDCNAGNVGTVLGVFTGLKGIPAKYRTPINDFIVLSGISGYLNNLDAADYAKFLYQLSLLSNGKQEDETVKLSRGGELLFDFKLPGSSHGIRLSNEIRYMKCFSDEGMSIVVDRILPEDKCRVYYKPFYRRSDFNDERYKPVFSPTVYPGQKMTCRFTPEFFLPGSIHVTPYVKTAVHERTYTGETTLLEDGRQTVLQLTVPDTQGDMVAEIGFMVEAAPETTSRVFAQLKMHSFTVTGKGSYCVDPALCATEFLQQIPYSHNHGQWSAPDGWLYCRTQESAESYTGNYYATDVSLSAEVSGHEGFGPCLIARAAGARRLLMAGLLEEGRAGFLVRNNGEKSVVSLPYAWEKDRTYHLELTVRGREARLVIDGEQVLKQELELPQYGMVGFGQDGAGANSFGKLFVCENGPYVDRLRLTSE